MHHWIKVKWEGVLEKGLLKGYLRVRVGRYPGEGQGGLLVGLKEGREAVRGGITGKRALARTVQR